MVTPCLSRGHYIWVADISITLRSSGYHGVRMMATIGQVGGLKVMRQVQLLLLFALLTHIGLLAFCSTAMAMDAPVANELGIVSAGRETEMASTIICSARGGDCLLSWTAPVSPSKTSYALTLTSVVGEVWLPHEGIASLQLASHALDPPSGVRPQALLQVFRI